MGVGGGEAIVRERVSAAMAMGDRREGMNAGVVVVTQDGRAGSRPRYCTPGGVD
jgi:hypothetical protein